MFSGKIFFVWDKILGNFIPSGGDLNKDSDGNLFGYGSREISQWLISEIHGVDSADFWLNNIKKIRSNDLSDGDFGLGNAHWSFLTKNYVMLSCEYVEELKVLLFLEQFEYIIEQYKIFLEYGNDAKKIPSYIDVEYISEGSDAVEIYLSVEGAYTYIFED